MKCLLWVAFGVGLSVFVPRPDTAQCWRCSFHVIYRQHHESGCHPRQSGAFHNRKYIGGQAGMPILRGPTHWYCSHWLGTAGSARTGRGVGAQDVVLTPCPSGICVKSARV